MKYAITPVLALSLFAVTFSSNVSAHCQIPCGIYGDQTRFDLMLEHVDTIEKSMKAIIKLQAADEPDANQLVRWVANKDSHADELTHIATYYFLAQRVTPVEEGKGTARAAYVKKVELLHRIIVRSMKAKQTTDLAHTGKLRELIEAFHHAYSHSGE